MNNQFSVLSIRISYLDRMLSHFTNYNPDTQKLLNDYLPKIKILSPTVHDILLQLYTNVLSNSKKKEEYERYLAFQNKIIEYIELKKNNSLLDKLKILDIWGQVFPQAENKEKSEEILHASDQVEDCLWLFENFPTNLRDRNICLNKEFEKLQNELSNYCKLLLEDNTSISCEVMQLVQEIKKCLEKNDNSIQEKIDLLKELIKVKK